VRGKTPQLGILLEVEEVYFHCARAFRRAALWQPERWIDRAELPSFGQILLDQTHPNGCSAADLDARLEESNTRLY
jgi:hypothetical protein